MQDKKKKYVLCHKGNNPAPNKNFFLQIEKINVQELFLL